MTNKQLYRVTRPDGGVTVTPSRPSGGGYTITHRLIADDGKLVTDGITTASCIDVDDINGWYEIDDPDYEAPTVN